MWILILLPFALGLAFVAVAVGGFALSNRLGQTRTKLVSMASVFALGTLLLLLLRQVLFPLTNDYAGDFTVIELRCVLVMVVMLGTLLGALALWRKQPPVAAGIVLGALLVGICNLLSCTTDSFRGF